MAFISRPFNLRFPVTGVVTSMYLGTRRGTDVDLAHLEIAIVNQRGEPQISNGQAVVPGEESVFVGALGLMGKGRRWYMLSKPVLVNETWRLQLRNTYADMTEITADLVFELMDAKYPKKKPPLCIEVTI